MQRGKRRLIRGDKQVADVYLTEFMCLLNHFYFRQVANRKAEDGTSDPAVAHLSEDDSWVAGHFRAENYRSKRRELFGIQPQFVKGNRKMEISLTKLEPRHAHDLLTSAIIPRPIAWVSTLSEEGRVNLAPFSFFTGVSWSPPILAFSVVNRADGTMKDTVRNIREVPEFVVHIVSVDLLSIMEHSAKPLPYGTDETSITGIHWIPSKMIKPRRIQEAKVAFECVLERIVAVSEGPDAGNLVLGRIRLVHVRDDLVKNGREVDWLGLDVLGRLSGNRYCSVRSVIESETN